jgi:hypothetical protein
MGRERLDHLADRAGLGVVEAVYRPRLAPLAWFALGGPAALVGTVLWQRYGAPADAGPGRIVWPLVGVAFAAVCLVLAVATILDSGRRIAVCAGGLVHRRRNQVEAVRWDAVRHLRRRPRTSYEVDCPDGMQIAWDEDVRGHLELFRAVERRVMPLLLAHARERLAAGDHVAFDGLVVTRAGLSAEGVPEPMPWSDVAAVTFGHLGEALVRRRGGSEPWFTGMVPDEAVLRTLVDELLPARRQPAGSP